MVTNAVKALFWAIFIPLLMAGCVAVVMFLVYGVPALLHRVVGA